MRELYNYLSLKRDEMSDTGKSTVEIEMKYLFKLHQVVCFMMQIRNIVNFDDDSERLLYEIKHPAWGVKDDD
jgi:hypothetical protein